MAFTAFGDKHGLMQWSLECHGRVLLCLDQSLLVPQRFRLLAYVVDLFLGARWQSAECARKVTCPLIGGAHICQTRTWRHDEESILSLDSFGEH